MEWTRTLDRQRPADVPPELVISPSRSADGAVRLGVWIAALGLVRLAAALFNYTVIGREGALSGQFSMDHWLQFVVERPPLLVLTALWPVVLGIALYRTGWHELLKAGAFTFLVFAISDTLSFVADWGHDRNSIDLGTFRLSKPIAGPTGRQFQFWMIALLGGAQVLGETWVAMRASVLVWKGPSRAPAGPDLKNATRRGWIGALAMAVSLGCLWAPPRLPVWSAYTGLLRNSALLRNVLLKTDTRRDRRNRPAFRHGLREHRDYFLLKQGLLRAEAAWKSERYVEARKEYEQLAERALQLPLSKLGVSGQHEAASVFNGYAWLLATCPEVQLRDPMEAASAARRALEMNPDDSNIWNTLGVAYFRQGNWDEARNALYRSMELSDEGDSRDWFFLAMIYAKLNNPERARGWYDRAVESARETAPGDAELYRFQVEAAEMLGFPKPKRVVAPPSRRSLYRGSVPHDLGPPPRGPGETAPPGERHLIDPHPEAGLGVGDSTHGSD